MEKPTMEKYGYHYQTGFDDQPSGWMFEGGEDAYYEALKKWEDAAMEGIIKKYLQGNDIPFMHANEKFECLVNYNVPDGLNVGVATLCEAFNVTPDWANRTCCSGTQCAAGAWKCVIEILSDSEASIYSIFPMTVPPKQRHDVAMYLMQLNCQRVFGRFELDLDSGEIKFKTHIDCTHVPFSDKILDKTLFINMATVQKYIPEFLAKLNHTK